MYNKKILGIIRKEIEDFNSKSIEIVQGYNFNQRKTLNTIELYFNNKFETGDKDSEGFHKFFYNIVHFPCDVATKAIDLDTKDFRLVPESPEAQVPTIFLSKEIKDWMKTAHFGTVLNEIMEALPKYGTVVVKKIKDELEIINLHNLINDPSVDELDDSFVIETHIMSPQDLREMPWDKDAIERVIALYQRDPDKNSIKVRERWGWVMRSEIDDNYDGKDESVYYFCVTAGVEKFEEIQNSDQVREMGEILYAQEVDPEKDFPYNEVHWEKVRGRWLGIGLVERMFDPQIRMNELQNLKSKALYWSSKILFQSTDDTIAKNLLTDVTNGDILKVKSVITEMPIRNPDLEGFTQEEQRWDKRVQEDSFSFETETGESLPSGTPFRLGALLKGSSGGFYNFKREKVGLFLKDLFFEVIIPSFKKSKRKKHFLTIPKDDKDLQALMERYADFLIYTKVQEFALKTSFLPSFDEIQKERDQLTKDLASRKNLFIEIPDSFYDEAQFSMDLIITDEQIDIGQKLETISNLVQLIGANPALLDDPKMKSMIFAAMNLAGVNPIELGLDAPSQLPQGQPQQPGQPGVPQGSNSLSVPNRDIPVQQGMNGMIRSTPRMVNQAQAL